MSNFHISGRSLAGYRTAVTRKLSSSKAAISVANPVLVTVKSNVELLQARSKYLNVWDQYISERDSLEDAAYSALTKNMQILKLIMMLKPIRYLMFWVS